MSDLFYSILGFVIALSILVTVHEFGHFWVARRLGVKVLRFSIGFGKSLWSKRAGPDDTEYVIAAIPLGGYVKMLDENEGEVAVNERHRAFNRQSLTNRSLIVLAGPVANFLFAVLAYWLVFMVGLDGIRPVVGKVIEGSFAAQSGFRAGDEILTVDGRRNQAWDEHRMYLFNKALARSSVTFKVRDTEGRLRERELDLAQIRMEAMDAGFMEKAVGLYGYFPEIPPVVGSVLQRSPAARAGIQVGDRIVGMDGTAVTSWWEVVRWVRGRAGQKTRLAIERDGERLTVVLVPEPVAVGDQTVGRIGIGVRSVEVPYGGEWKIPGL